MGWRGLALAGCQSLLRQPLVPTDSSEPPPEFFELYYFSWSPVTESNRRPSPYHNHGAVHRKHWQRR